MPTRYYVTANGTSTGSQLLPVNQADVTYQLITGGVVNVTATGCTILVKQSRGTLLLTDGPFENAAAGQVVKISVIGS